MLDSDLFRTLIAEASLAPSVHNIQPTRWRLLSADTVLLLEDERRRVPAADPTGHDVRLSHGAALEGLSLAAGRHGFRIMRVELDERPDRASGLRVIARLTLASGGTLDPLAAAVAGRSSWRGRFLPVDAALHDALGKLATVPDLRLVPIALAAAKCSCLRCLGVPVQVLHATAGSGAGVCTGHRMELLGDTPCRWHRRAARARPGRRAGWGSRPSLARE